MEKVYAKEGLETINRMELYHHIKSHLSYHNFLFCQKPIGHINIGTFYDGPGYRILDIAWPPHPKSAIIDDCLNEHILGIVSPVGKGLELVDLDSISASFKIHQKARETELNVVTEIGNEYFCYALKSQNEFHAFISLLR